MENQDNNILVGGFQVQKAGYYVVSSPVYTSKPSGEFETVPNPYRKWFEFWEPKFITREKFTTEVTHAGREVRFLRPGDTVESTFPPMIIGPN